MGEGIIQQPTSFIIASSNGADNAYRLVRTGNIYILYFYRRTEINNGATCFTIPAECIPASNISGYNFYQQATGFRNLQCVVGGTSGNYPGDVKIFSSVDEPVSGFFTVVWEK